MTDNSAALERPAVAPAPAIMGSAEMEQTWRVAKALAASGFFKDAQQAEQAFGKILLGRDMGLAPMEAMLAIHLIEGKAEMSADFHATRVKLTPGYDYDVEFFGTENTDAQGCSLTFYGPKRGEPDQVLGVSKFTVADAKQAGLWDRKGPKGGDGNWKKYPRNMLFARAMSNGVAWFCPEVMGAVRVYSPGEVEDMAPPVGEAAPEMTPGALETALIAGGLSEEWARPVFRTVERAQKLGHAGHGNAATVEMLLRGQPVEKVRAWLTATNDDLDLLAGNPDDVPDADPKTWPAWWCPDCGQKNAGWSRDCGRCETVRPGGPAPLDWQQPPPEDALVVEDGDDGEPVRCPAIDPDRGVRCDLPADHERHHRADGEGWDSFLPDAEPDADTADPAEQPGLEGVE